MKKLFIFLLAFAAMQLNAQDLTHYKQIVEELSSAKYQGRGYAKDGANLAGYFLHKEFEKAGVDVAVCQPFTIDINTFAGKMVPTWPDISFIKNSRKPVQMLLFANPSPSTSTPSRVR